MRYEPKRTATIVVGGWFGDEGKGKIISYIAENDNFQHVARAGVGPNAGHTVYVGEEKFGLRMVPSGFTNESAIMYIGKGVLVDPAVLLAEVEKCGIDGRFYVDRLCPVIEQRHIDEDRNGYNRDEVGSTGTGCGPTQLERVGRSKQLIFVKDLEGLGPYLADVSSLLLAAIERNEKVLVEMTQGTMLSNYGFEVNGNMTFHNSTSKDTTAGSACADVGIGPTNIEDVIVVYKAIPSRVGPGWFPGELTNEDQEILRQEGKGEYGTVTGRPRRLGGWTPDVVELSRRTAQINGATQIAITKVDMLYEGNTGIRDYNNLTRDAHVFVERLEDEFQRPVTLIGTGPEVHDIVDRR